MLSATLNRFHSDDQGTFGRLSALGFECYTLELPWRDNHNGTSCIPEGSYKVKWTLSPRLKHFTYEIQGVPNRAGIRIHGGNLAGDVSKGFVSHSLGCPLLGARLGVIGGQKAVSVSQPTLKKFERLMNKQSFILEIKNA